MHLHDFARNLAKRALEQGLEHKLHPAATDEIIRAAEARLGVTFHEQICRFYSFCDGCEVVEPHFQIHSLSDVQIVEPSLLHFCTVDSSHQLCFDTSTLNEAGQWFIVDRESGFRVTYTMASIWSTKIWAWLDWGTPIWRTL